MFQNTVRKSADPQVYKQALAIAESHEDWYGNPRSAWGFTGGLTQVFGRWQQVLFLRLNRETTGFPDGTEDDALLLIPGISYSSMPPNFLTGWMRTAAYYFELSGSPSLPWGSSTATGWNNPDPAYDLTKLTADLKYVVAEAAERKEISQDELRKRCR